MRSENFVRLLRDARRARREGPDAIAQRQRTRLAGIVAHARAHSPYFRELYKGLPDRVEDPSLLPVTDKKQLMARFDDWVTDRAVTIEKVRAFMSDPHLIGDRFLDRYTALTTSGTTGTPGIFVLDDRTMTVTNALALRMLRAWLRGHDVFRIIARGGRVDDGVRDGRALRRSRARRPAAKAPGDNAVQVLPRRHRCGRCCGAISIGSVRRSSRRTPALARDSRASRTPAAADQPGAGRALGRGTASRRLRSDRKGVRTPGPSQLCRH